MSKFISQNRSQQWFNLDLPVTQFKVHMQGWGCLWLPCELSFVEGTHKIVYSG